LETKETYAAQRARHQSDVDNFPMFFAFNNKQFAEGMAKFGLTPDDTDKIYSLGMASGYYLKTDAEKLHEMFDRHAEELESAMKDPDFAKSAFRWELNNHEYCITHDISDTLDSLGLTEEEVANSEILKTALINAKKQYWEDYEAHEKRQNENQ
jgi:hypothetical protein